MSRVQSLVQFLLMASALTFAAIPPISYDPDNYEFIGGPYSDDFSMQFAKSVLKDNNGNIITSPFSVKLILAVLLEASGISSTTQQELIQVQGNLSMQEIRNFYRSSLDSLDGINAQKNLLLLNTKLFVDFSIESQQKFAAALTYNYRVLIERLNFSDIESAKDIINRWAANATNGHLSDLVNTKNIENSAMLLVNTIYFEGQWRYPFNSTFDGVFLKTLSEHLQVKYMQQSGYFYYCQSDQLKAKMLRLPYTSGISMFVLLPNDNDGIHEMINSLNDNSLRSALRGLRKLFIKVTMPKFRFEHTLNLKDTLVGLGVQEIFKASASLPGLSRGAGVAGKVKASNVIQKAGIDLDENGTVAFAATIVEIENKFGGDPIVEQFNANHSFLFLIMEEFTNNIFFVGSVNDPKH